MVLCVFIMTLFLIINVFTMIVCPHTYFVWLSQSLVSHHSNFVCPHCLKSGAPPAHPSWTQSQQTPYIITCHNQVQHISIVITICVFSYVTCVPFEKVPLDITTHFRFCLVCHLSLALSLCLYLSCPHSETASCHPTPNKSLMWDLFCGTSWPQTDKVLLLLNPNTTPQSVLTVTLYQLHNEWVFTIICVPS